MRRMRGHSARDRNGACLRGCATLCGGPSGRADPDRLFGSRRQGHADFAAYGSEGCGVTMSPKEAISAAIRAARHQGRPAVVGFLTAGFPRRRGFRENLAAVATACDVVEIGVPFTDPMADGTTIQRASFAALADGVTLPWILEEVRSVARPGTAPILLMSYLNPLLAYGLDRLPQDAAAAGVAGFIVPDL